MNIREGSEELCDLEALSEELSKSKVDELEVETIKEKPYSVFNSIMNYFNIKGYPSQFQPYCLPKVYYVESDKYYYLK